MENGAKKHYPIKPFRAGLVKSALEDGPMKRCHLLNLMEASGQGRETCIKTLRSMLRTGEITKAKGKFGRYSLPE